MKPSIWDILTGVMVLAITCLACAFTQIFFNPSVAFNPFPPPTAVPQLVISIPTATVTTVLRELPPTWTPVPTLEASATAPMVLKPSSTLPPTATLFIMPTHTPQPTTTRTSAPTRADGRCIVVDESPKDNTEYNPGQEFDKRWTIRNQSGGTWRSDNLDIRYLSGTRMHTGADAYDLQRDVANNDSYEVTVRMRAPGTQGTYSANWGIAAGSNSVCNFFVKIIVK